MSCCLNFHIFISVNLKSPPWSIELQLNLSFKFVTMFILEIFFTVNLFWICRRLKRSTYGLWRTSAVWQISQMWKSGMIGFLLGQISWTNILVIISNSEEWLHFMNKFLWQISQQTTWQIAWQISWTISLVVWLNVLGWLLWSIFENNNNFDQWKSWLFCSDNSTSSTSVQPIHCTIQNMRYQWTGRTVKLRMGRLQNICVTVMTEN